MAMLSFIKIGVERSDFIVDVAYTAIVPYFSKIASIMINLKPTIISS